MYLPGKAKNNSGIDDGELVHEPSAYLMYHQVIFITIGSNPHTHYHNCQIIMQINNLKRGVEISAIKSKETNMYLSKLQITLYIYCRDSYSFLHSKFHFLKHTYICFLL